MIVANIIYSTKFIKEFRKLPEEIKMVTVQKEKIFKTNPLHPSLRLHELNGNLKGTWSISLNKNYRIVFERQNNGDILFISIGKHDIYKNL